MASVIAKPVGFCIFASNLSYLRGFSNIKNQLLKLVLNWITIIPCKSFRENILEKQGILKTLTQLHIFNTAKIVKLMLKYLFNVAFLGISQTKYSHAAFTFGRVYLICFQD